jgi:NAD(P)-dependent dehydrogenase (short-subunit alcohol dehydrogenase family)
MSKVWFITGGGRAMGTDIAKVAFDAGYKVVATGRNTDRVVRAFRTELLTEESTNYPEPTIDDYSEKTRPAVPTPSRALNGRSKTCWRKPMPARTFLVAHVR